MRLHHIAYVCADIEQQSEIYVKLLHAKRHGDSVIDRHQGVKILFLDLPDGTRIELLQPHGDKSPVRRFLEKGGGLYHLCFEVDHLDVTLDDMTKDGRAIVVKSPAPAPAINNRCVAFVVTEQKELIEFVEKKD